MQIVLVWVNSIIEPAASDESISILEGAISLLEMRSESWERWLWICTGAVVLGVALDVWVVIKEYRDNDKAWRRGTIRSPEQPSRCFFGIELLATILITLGVSGELVIGVKSGDINTALRDKNRQLVSIVRERAASADSS